MQKFFQGGEKEGGGEAYVRCYTLHVHLLGGENDTRGGMPLPPLNTALGGRERVGG